MSCECKTNASSKNKLQEDEDGWMDKYRKGENAHYTKVHTYNCTINHICLKGTAHAKSIF